MMAAVLFITAALVLASSAVQHDTTPRCAGLDRGQLASWGILTVNSDTICVAAGCLSTFLNATFLSPTTGTCMVPAFRNGRVTGIKLFCIPGINDTAPIPLRAGDVVESINGIRPTTPESAMTVGRLINHPPERLTFTFTRRDERMQFTVFVDESPSRCNALNEFGKLRRVDPIRP